ncbi:MAG: Undecaprenyl-phosphate 4-deoxy-4-formamido-L-arabinose transferase, partial [Verrucomicrobiota bacterium]
MNRRENTKGETAGFHRRLQPISLEPHPLSPPTCRKSRVRFMPHAISALALEHLDRVRTFYDGAPVEPQTGARHYRGLLAHYYNLLIPPSATVLEIGCGSGELLAQLRARTKTGIDLSARQIAAARRRLPEADFHLQAGELLELDRQFDVIIVSDTLNLAADVQRLLERLAAVAHSDTRLILNFQNTLWRPLLSFARALGLKAAQPQNSWLAASDVLNLLRLAGWNPVFLHNRI